MLKRIHKTSVVYHFLETLSCASLVLALGLTTCNSAEQTA